MSAVAEGAKPSASSVVGRAGGIMGASIFLSRVLGLLRDTFIASHFGLGTANDSFQIAAKIPDLIFMLIAGGGLSSAFIPIFTEYWYTGRTKEAWKVFSVIVTLCSIIAVALITVAWVYAPQIVEQFAHGKPRAVIDQAVIMSRIMLPAQYAFLIGSVLLGTLYARKQFAAPGLAPNVYNIGIILGATVMPSMMGVGIVSVAWGALIGAFVGNLLLPVLAMIPQGGSFIPSLNVRTPGVGQFFKLLLPVIIGFSLPSMVSLVTQYFASPYGAGSNAVLQYSNNLMQAPLGIFGQGMALAVFPVLGEFYAQKRMDLYKSQISKTLRTVLYLSIPSSVLMFGMAPLIVKVIYGYGAAAHDSHHLVMISNCLRIYCLAIAAWCLQPVLMRGFFSLHQTLRPIAWSTATTALFVAICYGVQFTHWNLYALPWATNLCALILVVILYFSLERAVGKLDRLGILRTVARSGVSSIPLGLVAYGGAAWHVPSGRLISILWFAFVACIAGWSYYYCTSWFHMPETAYLDKAFTRLRLRRKS